MVRDIKDGVSIDKSIILIDEKKQGFPLSTRVIQFLIILIAAWSGIGILVETFGIACNPFQTNAAILISAGIFYALCIYPAYDMVKIFFVVLFYGLYLYSRLPRLTNGFYIIENLTMDRVSPYYGTPYIQFLADYTVEKRDSTLFVIMIVILLVALLSITVVRGRYKWFSSLLLLLPIVICFAFGLIPSERYLLACIISLFYLIKSAINNNNEALRKQQQMIHKISSKAAIWLSLICILAFFVIKFFVTQEAYGHMTQIEDAKTKLQTAITDFSWDKFTNKVNEVKIFQTEVSSGGLSGGVLGETGQVQYTNEEHLKLKALLSSVQEGIYLKGYVGSDYTGDSWNGHSEKIEKEYKELQKKLLEKNFSSENQMSQFLSGATEWHSAADANSTKKSGSGIPDYRIYEGTMDIEYKKANKSYLYTPYFSDYNTIKNIKFITDLYAEPTIHKDNYTCDYYFNINVFQPDFYAKLKNTHEEFSEGERLYRDFVYQVYTILPEEGLTKIKRDFAADKDMTKTGSIPEKIAYVRDYLDRNTTYSLSPGTLPKGKDFVEYFLYENKIGYCTHYASAATLMLRAMGIPARYVEGYCVDRNGVVGTVGHSQITNITNKGTSSNMDSLVSVSVKDSDAHAWVEVYLDYIGWVPVEFTPGSRVDYNQTVVTELNDVAQSLKKEDNTQDKEDQKEQITTPTPAITPSITPPAKGTSLQDQQKNTSGKAGIAGKASITSNAKKSDALYLILLIIACVLLIIFYILYRRNKAYRSRTRGTNNERVIYFYGEIEKMLIISRCLPKKALLEESEAYIKEHSSYIDAYYFERLMETVRKARFGSGMISEQELKEVISYHNQLYHTLYDERSLLQRFLLNLRLTL